MLKRINVIRVKQFPRDYIRCSPLPKEEGMAKELGGHVDVPIYGELWFEVYSYFSDGTLTSVRSVLHDIASNLRMDYLPKRRWSSLDRKRSRIMIKAIDQLLLERRLMRSLEKFVGGRDYGKDLRLLQRTI
ncbi:hypothetical protein Tco_0209958 [Tanacetum coccineum]